MKMTTKTTMRFRLVRCCTVFFVYAMLTGMVQSQTPNENSPFAEESVDFQKWGPRLPNDSLMPEPQEIRQIARWTNTAFAGSENPDSFDQSEKAKTNGDTILKVVRQEHASLKTGESCMGTPLIIGAKKFSQGIGTHANSELEFEFPDPILRFTATVGVDNNYSTGGIRGSVQFVVFVKGKEIFRSLTQKGNDEPLSIDIKMEPSDQTRQLTLRVETTEDGPACDQADWCEPVAWGTNGKQYDLSKVPHCPMLGKIPFSFRYDGKTSQEFLRDWKFELKEIDNLNTIYSWTDPKTELRVDASVRRFERFCGVEWTLRFTNNGAKETPILEDVNAIDLDLDMGIDQNPIVVNTLSGDSCDVNSWLPVKYPLKPGEKKRFAPKGGRSSNGAFPFWNIQRKDGGDNEQSEGLFVALGWSGQWTAEFARMEKNRVSVHAGMETLSTVLFPQESIRSPKILIMPWKNDRLNAQALFRRLLMFEYAPKMQNGLPLQMPVVGQCFDRYYRKRPNWEKIDGQLAYAEKLKEAGCEAHWFDAAWFPVGFPNGVGNWFSDPVGFPGGVEELGNAVHKLKMQFILWFEPERVAKNTQIANEYPQYVFGGKEGGLFKLNDPEARKFLTELLLKRIKEFGVDVYRNDFNIDPLEFWKANDAPNRKGITEIRYVEGHYEMWNRLIKENPGLWIDNCASGGRRIDLESIGISVPLWRSDTCCWPDHPEWDQTQTLGIAQYIPLFSCSVWESDPYVFRSGANFGAIAQFNFLDDDYNPEQAKNSLVETKIHRKFWYGDFYPLTDAVPGQGGITAWQLHRSDLDAGLAYLFRQPQSPYLGIELALRGIDPAASYRINIKHDYSEGEFRTLTGKELLAMPILMPEKHSSMIIRYEKCSK